MTRKEVIDRHRHELAGLALDIALTRDSGANLSMKLFAIYSKVDGMIGRIYDDVAGTGDLPKTADLAPPTNGVRGKTPLLPG